MVMAREMTRLIALFINRMRIMRNEHNCVAALEALTCSSELTLTINENCPQEASENSTRFICIF